MQKFILIATAVLMLLSIQTAFAESNRLLFVHGMHTNKAKVSLIKDLARERGIKVDQKAQADLADLDVAEKVFSQYQLVVLESANERLSMRSFTSYIPLIQNSTVKFIAINAPDNPQLNNGVETQKAQTLHAYYDNGGVENFSRMVEYLDFKVFANDGRVVAPPIIYPEIGIYHPHYKSLIFERLDDYLRWRNVDAQQPKVGVLFQRQLIEAANTNIVDETIQQLERKGMTAVPFFFELSENSKDYLYLIQDDGKTALDLIVNFRTIHWVSQRKKEFEKIGVPVLQALTYFDGDQKHWEASSQGISPAMTPFTMVLPEAAGVLDPMIVAAVNEKTGNTEVIDYQLEHLVNKAVNTVNLKYKPNSEKRLTVMVWGNRDVGASFLNVPESLRAISAGLNDEGYSINKVDSAYFSDQVERILSPFYRDYELDALLQDDLAELMPVSDYLSWFDALPAEVTQPINEYWGHPTENFMVVERDGKTQFVLPRIRNGNLLVMRQPPRGDDKDEDKRIYHKGTVPMNHFYLAAYYYSRTFWNSDAIIHLGTHGSQEYLAGKERGLSIYDQGNLAVWDTPVLYPFIVDDVGEAMQTKRRGRATVLAHMTPPFAASGLQGEMANIHELMHQYKSLDEGGVKQKTAQQLSNECLNQNICDDFGWTKQQIEQDFDGFLEALHDYLAELANENQPLGLHTYGELPEQDLVISTLVQMLGADFVEQVAKFERAYFNSQIHSHSDHDHSHGEHDHSHDNQDNVSGDHDHQFSGGVMQESSDNLEDLVGFKTVREFIVNSKSQEQTGDVEMEESLQAYIIKGRQLYEALTANKEMHHMIDALAGRYVAVKNGGDPIRHPEAVPTGFNLYGFDPSRVPTKAAYEQGKELTQSVIADYYAKHGRYPEKLAFSLWSIETMRHYGVLESQALYALGVRPKWSADGRVIGTEIIPASELKRPRVDVVLSATGLYRDAFPNVMQTLAKAIEQIAQLKEESNFVWRNSQKVEQALLAEGVEPEEAKYLSSVRVFSSASGNYGSGVENAVFASDTWDSDSKIADLYLHKMGYFYGSDNSRWGQQGADYDLYAKQLSGTDVAMFSRSSNVYGMLSSDDPFEYFGALALAVRNLDGASPEMVISNLRDANRPKAEMADQFLAKELRSRNFHKRWVSEMMKEGYSGAVTLSSHLSNFWGWQVVDPNLVRDDQWQTFYEVYVEDSLELGINEWFEQTNPASQAQMLERMLEANRKEYWQANQATLNKMLERYVELVQQHDLFMDNEKLREYVNAQALGFGLQPLPVAVPEVAAEALANNGQPVQGQVLEKVEPVQPSSQERDWQLLSVAFICLLVFVLGMLSQMQYGRRLLVS